MKPKADAGLNRKTKTRALQALRNLMDGTKLPDLSGSEFATDEAAIAHARLIAANIVAFSPEHNGPQRFVSVIHEDGHEVVRVPVYKQHTHR